MLAVWVEQLLGFASGALAAIREDEHYPAFMVWVRQQGGGYFDDYMPMAQALAPILWSQTPLERLAFDTEPLAPPAPAESCWCDSGLKYEQCCARVEVPTEIPPHMMWMLALRDWTGTALKGALQSGKAPPQALLEAGLVEAEGGQSGRAMQMLETLFAIDDWHTLPEQAEPGFEILLDIYQARGFNRKRSALLDDVMAAGSHALRGVALERLCLTYLDEDDLDSARRAFVRAQQALPDSPTLAYIEAMLLLHEGHEDEARQRAAFWFRRLSRQGQLDDDQRDFLAALADNPSATLADQLLSAEDDLATPLISLQSVLAARSPAPPLRFSHQEDGRLAYQRSAGERQRHAEWQAHFQTRVDQDQALGFDDDPWPFAVNWMSALCEHSHWLDTPEIVQDLSLALTHRFGSLPWMAPSLFEPLAERLGQWLDQAKDIADGNLRWDLADNAILLRTGLALVVGMERGDRQHSRELAERLLAINHDDSLGLRELVVDQLLRDDRNQEALALSQDIPSDGSARLNLMLGKALALYRLGQHDASLKLLNEVMRYNRHAVELLRADNPRAVKLPASGEVAPGSRAEAWQYRTLMRDQWRSTPGALDLLSTL